LTTGNDNTAVGSFAGLWVKTNIFNTAVGSAALRYSDGYGNVAVGHGAMAGNDPPVAPVLHTGASNTVIGSWSFQVLKGNTNSNTGLGTSSGAWISNGSDNVAIGALAVAGCTVGDSMCGAPGPGDVFASQNVGVGNEALRYTKSNAQVALGMQALLNNTTGQLSTALGHQALKASVADVRNVAIGYNVLAANNGGNDNTAAGTYAMIAATTGSSNAVFGSEAGSKLTTGNNNTVIGPYVASTTLTTGSNNLLLGVSSACDTAAPGDSNIFQVCGTGGPVWSAINTHIPVNSTTTIAGTLKVNAWLASAGGGGLYVCVDSAGVMYRKASCP
jgi:hypothetical protein